MKCLNILRTIGSVVAASILALTIMACSLYQAIAQVAVARTTWEDILARESVQKRIDTIIVNSTGLWQLRPLDENLYGQIFVILRREVADPFLADLPRAWTAWLSGATNRFDPVMDLSAVRGKVIWMLKQTVRSRLPEIFVRKMEQRIERNFSKKVPTAMRMLPLIGVSSNTELAMKGIRQDFVQWYRVRLLVWLVPLAAAILWFWAMRKRQYFPESLAGLVGGTALMVLMPLAVFSGQIGEIAGTIVRLKSGSGEWAEMADVVLSAVIDNIRTPLGILGMTGIAVLLILAALRWWRRRSFA